MKTVKNFLIDFAICLLISLPCFFLCDYLSQKGAIDWLDIQIALSSFAIIALIAYILIGRRKKDTKIAGILNTVAILALASTVIYGVFMILEWLFPNNADSGFTGNWVQWFPTSISIATFLHLQERRRAEKYRNENDLVVAAECRDKAEAEAVCVMLEEKGIKAISVEKGNPMYIKSESGAPVQIQVMGKDLQSAKKIIK